MKKIQLSIPKPCDADWNGMTPEDRGRFCGACQKTVIDFTAMSDRQLAEFFKKKPVNVCGQFHTDQLHRDIVLPRKRIPWVKYFFQVIWPAWVVFLTSCGQRTRTTGEAVAVTAASQPVMKSRVVIGDTILMSPVAVMVTPPEAVTLGTPVMIGEVEELIPAESVSKAVDTGERPVDTVISAQPLDTVVVTGYDTFRRGEVVMGILVQVSACSTVKTKDAPIKQPAAALPKVFPNPVRRGGMVTVSVAAPEALPDHVELISTSGQLVAVMKQKAGDDAAVFNIAIPSGITPGIYFLRLTSTRRKTSVTEKVLIQ